MSSLYALATAAGWQPFQVADDDWLCVGQERQRHHDARVRVVAEDGAFRVTIAHSDPAVVPKTVVVPTVDLLTALLRKVHERAVIRDRDRKHRPTIRCRDCAFFRPAVVRLKPLSLRESPGGCALALNPAPRRPLYFPITGHYCEGWWPKNSSAPASLDISAQPH